MILGIHHITLVASIAVLLAGASGAHGQDLTGEDDSDSPIAKCANVEAEQDCDITSGRAQENAVRQADDAFGATIGRESIGIYSAYDVRGFSALAAGNARINGLYFDQVAGPSRQIRRSTAIRIGLSALDFPFPAPTGVVDYGLIRPSTQASLSAIVSADSYESLGLEVDFSLPVLEEQLAIGGGVGVSRDHFVTGGKRTQSTVAISALWKPVSDVELQPFWTRTDTYNQRVAPYYAPTGDRLPPTIPHRRFFGQDWAQFDGAALLYGITGRARLTENWMVEGGAFRSVYLTERDTFILLSDLQPDGIGRYAIFTDPPGTTTSTSGEFRVTYALSEGRLSHRIAASLRSRDRQQLFGGSDVQDYGTVTLGAIPAFPEPDFSFGEQSVDSIEQFSAGLSYSGNWQGVGSIIVGLSKSDYEKRVQLPASSMAGTDSSPLLYNGSVAIDLFESVAVYAGYTRGLEDSGSAPQSAVNRNEVLPAIVTSQREAGIRWAILDDLILLGGIFDIRKPYFSTDADGLFTKLGTTRNRGVELSLSGKIDNRLTLVAGAVLLDPAVSGEAVSLGNTGRRPVGLPRRRFDVNFDWVSPVTGVSFDLRLAHQSSFPANTLNTVFVPSRTLLDIGGRYQFQLGAAAATLRIFLRNLGNVHGYELRGSGTYDLIEGRIFGAYLSIDL